MHDCIVSSAADHIAKIFDRQFEGITMMIGKDEAGNWSANVTWSVGDVHGGCVVYGSNLLDVLQKLGAQTPTSVSQSIKSPFREPELEEIP